MMRARSPVFAVAAVGLTLAAVTDLRAQPTSPDTTPQPQLPPMPSMEGEQGDTGKPVAAALAKPRAKGPHPPRKVAKTRPGMKRQAAAKPRKPGH